MKYHWNTLDSKFNEFNLIHMIIKILEINFWRLKGIKLFI